MTDPAQRAIWPPTLEAVLADHVVQRKLCDELEAIADGLPALPSLDEVRALCDRIEHVTTTHFARAEAVFATLPVLQRPDGPALDMLHQMHQFDEVHAQDVVVALLQQALVPKRQDVGQIAYMLRCFFDGCRRAIALKESWIANGGGFVPPVRPD